MALQRTAGNAAVVRALGAHRRPAVNERLVQRAPVHYVMPLEHNFFFGQNNQHGYTVKPAVNGGIPAGYHVTIYPGLSPTQSIGALQGKKLGQLPEYDSIEFTQFNVTREANRTHYYFDDQGSVIWAHTKTEASLDDAHWENAIQAALAIYSSIGVNVTAQQLYDQLHRRGRKAPVSGADTFGRVLPSAQPQSTRSALTFVPPQLRRGKVAAPPKSVAKPVPPTALPQVVQEPPPQLFVQQPLVQQPSPQPALNPFPYQPFVREGETPPHRFVHPTQPQPSEPFSFWTSRPFVPLVPAQPDWEPVPVRDDPLAYLPVFAHEEEMEIDTTNWDG